MPGAEGGTLSAWLWKPDPFLACEVCLTNRVTPTHTRQYVFIGKNEYSCTDTAFAIVKTITGGSVNLPSAFSPNGDGLNDIFYVMAGEEVPLVRDFLVFNRWGQKVFEAKSLLPNDPRNGWNGIHKGVEAAPGTYIYLVRISGANGDDKVYKGTIVLLR
ncbi:MAG: gliding motility-associated C-terminal domain-containing protein [Ferruginibacter sp.]